MSQSVMQLISAIVPDVVNVVSRGEASEARLCISVSGSNELPIWVAVERIIVPQNVVIRTIGGVRDESIEVPESQLSATKTEKFWAHTNDWDGEVYGWSAAELFVVHADEQQIVRAIVDHLQKKLAHATRIDIKMLATTPAGKPSLPVIEGNSEGGLASLHEQEVFPSL